MPAHIVYAHVLNKFFAVPHPSLILRSLAKPHRGNGVLALLAPLAFLQWIRSGWPTEVSRLESAESPGIRAARHLVNASWLSGGLFASPGEAAGVGRTFLQTGVGR